MRSPAERLAALYAASDLFVLPSRYEGFGMAYAEAIAHGLPVIGTTAGAIPDTVPAAAGVLVPPDDVAALAAALRRLIENAGRARTARRRRPRGRRAPSDLARIGRTVLAGDRGGVMSGFSSSWLTLREPYDRRARNGAVLDAVAAWAAGRPSVAVVDLACGLGSTLARRSPNACRSGKAGGWSTTI